MQDAREADIHPRPERSSRSPISVALLAGIAFVPIVIAAGFLTDRGDPSLPGDITVAALRGALDRSPVERPASTRAGF